MFTYTISKLCFWYKANCNHTINFTLDSHIMKTLFLSLLHLQLKRVNHDNSELCPMTAVFVQATLWHFSSTFNQNCTGFNSTIAEGLMMMDTKHCCKSYECAELLRNPFSIIFVNRDNLFTQSEMILCYKTFPTCRALFAAQTCHIWWYILLCLVTVTQLPSSNDAGGMAAILYANDGWSIWFLLHSVQPVIKPTVKSDYITQRYLK